MNILWVEDNPENKKDFWFANRNVKTITDFSEAEETIEKELNSYDVVVLDIDLRNSNKEKVREKSNQFGLSPDTFLQKSGMVLFLTLLEKGFPRKQIIFLTGNADKNNFSKLVYTISSSQDIEQIKNATKKVLDFLSDEQKAELKQKSNKEDRVNYIKSLEIKQSTNTYDIFCDACKDICIKPPQAISKSNDKEAQYELISWLEDHEKNKYLVLRRGIIDGCNFLKEYAKNENDLQINSYTDNKIALTEISNYLDTLIQFLPINEPDNLNLKYRIFLRTLSHEWDICSINPNKDWNRERYNATTFVQSMIMVRNWVSHDILLEPLNEEIISFLFLVNMHAMFNLGNKLQDYEKKLLNCILNNPVLDNINYQIDINNSEERVNELLNNLENVCFNVDQRGNKVYTIENEHFLDKKTKERKPIQLVFFDKKINYLHKRKQNIYLKYGYQQFIFQYFFVSHLKNNSLWLKDISNSNDFLPTLARHIYSRSFS